MTRVSWSPHIWPLVGISHWRCGFPSNLLNSVFGIVPNPFSCCCCVCVFFFYFSCMPCFINGCDIGHWPCKVASNLQWPEVLLYHKEEVCLVNAFWCGHLSSWILFTCFNFHDFFRGQEPKAPVTYCDHALSGVRRPSVVRRPSSVRLFTFSTSSPEQLDGFWWNLVWMKYSRSLTSVVVFRPDPSRGGSRAGQK